MQTASLREDLAGSRRLLATFLLIPRVEIVEMLGLAGFDAVIVDLEHGPIGIAEIPAIAAGARGAGLHTIVRVGSGSPAGIGAVLDCGVDGVLVPHVASVSDARALVAAGRYPPEGERSLNPYVRGVRYGQEIEEGLNGFEESVALIALLEGAEAMEDFEEIASVPGLDGVFVGPVDLSGSLGHPGQPEHPVVVDAVRRAFSIAREAGCSAGVYAPTAEAAARWFDAGAVLVAVSADAAMIRRAFAAMHTSVAALVTDGPGDPG